MLDIALHLLNNWGHKSIESCKVILVLLVTCFNDIIKKTKFVNCYISIAPISLL